MPNNVREPHIANATAEPEEIEVTSEMIEAGVRAIAGYNPEFDWEEDVVAKIYREMVMAKSGRVSVSALHNWRVPQL